MCSKSLEFFFFPILFYLTDFTNVLIFRLFRGTAVSSYIQSFPRNFEREIGVRPAGIDLLAHARLLTAVSKDPELRE